MVETLSEHPIVFLAKEKRYLFGLGTSTVQNSVTVVLLRMSNSTWMPGGKTTMYSQTYVRKGRAECSDFKSHQV